MHQKSRGSDFQNEYLGMTSKKKDSVNSLEFDGTEANFARMENQITQTYHC